MPIQIPTLDFTPLIPLSIVIGTAVVALLADLAVRDKRWLGGLCLLGIAGALAATLMLWPGSASSFQKMAVSDGYALFFNLVFLTAAALAVLIAMDYLTRKDLQRGEYYVLLLFAVGGMMAMAAAQDLIIVYLGLEILSVAFYVLTGFNRRQMASVEAAMKYFILGAFASAFFLYGVALTYGASGSTNLAQIGKWLANSGIPGDAMALTGLALLLVGFGFKVALVPFQWWIPDVYQGAPTSVTALMSVGAKAAGFAALGRVLSFAFSPTFTSDWVMVTTVLAALTMTGGNLAALVQKDLKRMLGYSSIAHAGYILVGMAAAGFTQTGRQAVLFYMFAYVFMTVGAFAVACIVERRDQFSTTLSDYAGLGQRAPLLAAAMAVFMLSLTGIPPLVGFWGKLFVFRAAVEANLGWLAVLGVINSAISAFYYLGVLVQMYMRSAERPEVQSVSGDLLRVEVAAAPTARRRLAIGAAVLIAVLGTLLLGLWPALTVNLVMGM